MDFSFASCGLVSVLVVVCSMFGFSFLSIKKDPNKKKDTTKTQKKQNAEKQNKNQLAQLCSQIVFLIFGLRGLKMQLCAENRIKMVVSACFGKGKCPKSVKKVEQKSVQRLSQKSVQICCSTKLDSFDSNKW